MFRLNLVIHNLRSAIRPNADFARVVYFFNLNFEEYYLQCMFLLNIVILSTILFPFNSLLSPY